MGYKRNENVAARSSYTDLVLIISATTMGDS